MHQKRGGWRIGRLSAEQWLLIGMLLLAALGVLIGRDFGQGVDETPNAKVAWQFLNLYETGNLFTNPQIEYYNGPFYMMLWVGLGQGLHALIPAWTVIDCRHLVNFGTFLLGLWLLYRLSRRFMSPSLGLLTTALYASQPLLFGQAFINQKDMPLSVFFLACVALGWDGIDRCRRPRGTPAGEAIRASSSPVPFGWRRVGAAILLLACLGMLMDLWLFGGTLALAERTVRDAYQGASFAWVNAVFRLVATDAYKTSVSLYIAKLDHAAAWLRFPASLLCLVGVYWGVRQLIPVAFATKLRPWIRRWDGLILAGMVLGATTSIRLAGILAGALVAMIGLIRMRNKAILPLIGYGGVAIVTSYLTWPVLWGDPVGVFIQHVAQTTGRFNAYPVVFAGQEYVSGHLPWDYLPWLLGIELTIPALLVIIAGLIVALVHLARGSAERVGLIVLLMWAGVPIAAVMMGSLPIYDNFRHVLFILPPLFLLGGLGLQGLGWERLLPALRGALALVVLLPGMIGIVALHPYEYTYYNALIGGVSGAAQGYELDYWCISGREAMNYVNNVAEKGAKVAIVGNLSSFAPFKRSDLTVFHDPSAESVPDFAILCNRHVFDEAYPSFANAYAVKRGEAVMALVKSPRH